MTILIPAYQPDESMLQLIRSLQVVCPYSILIVDDGSDAACVELFETAEKLGCTVLHHSVNQGKGVALRTGFSYLLSGVEMEGAVTADCDGQHSVQDILAVAQEVIKHPQKIVLGVRTFSGKIPLRSRLGNAITRSAYRVACGQRLDDTQTGLRGVDATMFQWLVELEGDRYDYEMNMLLEAPAQGYSFLQIPIATIYINKNAGSHFHAVRDSVRVYKPIMRYGASGLISGLVDYAMLLALFYPLEPIISNWAMLIAVVGARIISSLCNFFINRTFVFTGNRRQRKRGREILRYYTLVLLLMTLNFGLMELLTYVLHIYPAIGKLITESILVLISFYLQSHWVFRPAPNDTHIS